MQHYLAALRQYATFGGRATRPQFWWFFLLHALIIVALSFTDATFKLVPEGASLGYLTTMYILATLVPMYAVGVRRLHDADLRGWWVVLNVIPVVQFALLVLWALKPSEGENRFGPAPQG